MRIIILSALPQEYAPLKKLFPAFRAVSKRPCRKFALNLPGKDIRLIETGMGDKAVKEAFDSEPGADLLLFSGFAGGLHPDLPTGSVCFAASARRIETGASYAFRFSEELSDFLARHGVQPVLALSADGPGDKRALSALADGAPAVLDMETATAAEEALLRHIPFLCFRAVSDAIDHDLGFCLEDICDDQWRVKPLRVLGTILKKPSTLPAFYRLWRNSSLAAKKLCAPVAAFLNLPAAQLERMAAGIGIEIERE
ncbi:MAG: hypothetical protein ACP5SH_18875 [Syntrophobacteraceae bacterium]